MWFCLLNWLPIFTSGVQVMLVGAGGPPDGIRGVVEMDHVDQPIEHGERDQGFRVLKLHDLDVGAPVIGIERLSRSPREVALIWRIPRPERPT